MPIKPTAVVVPSREVGGLLVEALDRLGVDSIRIEAGTPAKTRAYAYDKASRGEVVLVSVQVLAEGVDMPWLRRLVDARPTLSPVAWLQRLGRITRPGAARPEYITVCRNLERHSFLLGGLVPRRHLAAAQQEFEKPSKRSGHRSIGFEALSRFKRIPIPLLEGVTGSMYLLYNVDSESGKTQEWAVLLDPTSTRRITATRTNEQSPDGTRNYGKWTAAELPVELTGFATSQNHLPVSAKQKQWWERQARRHGLDPEPKKLTRRQFTALPVLANLRTNINAEE